MKKQELQQKLRELINKANPELLELKEDCRFWYWAGDRKSKLYCKMVNDTNYRLDKYSNRNQYIWGATEKMIKDAGGEIIGKDPQLNHLLIAIDKVVDINTGYTISQLGVLMINVFDIKGQSMTHKSILKLDLTKSLLEQDEKVLKELVDILS